MATKVKEKDESRDEKKHYKQMEKVAKYLRFNVRCKTGNIKGQKLEYFTGASAIDILMKSKWSKIPETESETVPYFSSRADAVFYCNRLLKMEFFVRANKIEVKSTETSSDGQLSEKKINGKQSDSDGGKKRKKFRLEAHKQQTFMDSADVYFWKYDPPSKSTYVIGFIVVLGAIAWTLQPLWPESTRVTIWYLAIGAAILIGVLLGLIIVRWLLFGIVFIFTAGKVYFWVFPYLNDEKRGFFESFKPFYSMEMQTVTGNKIK